MSGYTRRRFLQAGAAGGAYLFLPWAGRVETASAERGENGAEAREVRRARAGSGRWDRGRDADAAPNEYSFTQTEIARQLHPELPPTPLWAYDDGSGLAGQAGSFGMAVVAQSGTPLERRASPTSCPRRIRPGSRSTRG